MVIAQASQVQFRRREPADLPAAYRVFRRSQFEYLHRAGVLASPEISDA
jgi:hypothetical protein